MSTAATVKLERIWGLRVRDRRKLLGLSQRTVAELCEVTQQTIGAIERGKITPRDSLKRRIAEALRTTPGTLFPWEEQLGGTP